MTDSRTFSFIALEGEQPIPASIRQELVRVCKENVGKQMALTIEKREPARTLDQLAFYRGYVLPHVRKVRAEMGDPQDIDDVHEDLLDVFAEHRQVKSIKGEITSKPIRSGRMKKRQMSNFITAILAEMAHLGYPLPVSDEQTAWHKRYKTEKEE